MLTSDKGSLKCCRSQKSWFRFHKCMGGGEVQLRRGIMGRKPPSAFLSPWKSFPGDGLRDATGLELGLVLTTAAGVVAVVTGVRSWYTNTLSVRLSLSSSGVGLGGERSWPPPFCTVQSEVYTSLCGVNLLSTSVKATDPPPDTNCSKMFLFCSKSFCNVS